MKRFLTIIATILIIALVVFGVHSCRKSKYSAGTNDNPTDGIVNINPEQDSHSGNSTADLVEDLQNATDEEVADAHEKQLEESLKNSETFTGTGIYHGKADSSSVEITLDNIQPMLISAKLSPDLADKFASYDLAEESIISFEYKIIDEQYIITKIIK